MSADTAAARNLARATRSILKGAGAQLAGKTRGPDRRVRRDSYDVDDARAQVFRKIEDGSKAAGLAWADAILQTANEFDVVHKKKGERGPLQANGIRVLAAIVRRALDFATGQSDPELLTLAKWTARPRGFHRGVGQHWTSCYGMRMIVIRTIEARCGRGGSTRHLHQSGCDTPRCRRHAL